MGLGTAARRCDIADLWVSTKCGESDTTTGLSSCPTVGNMYDKLIPHGIHGCFGETSEITGAEHLAKERAASPEVGEKWYRIWKAYQDDVIEAHKTDDLSDSQPTKGNIAGGLTPSRRRPSATSRRSGASAATSMRSSPRKRPPRVRVCTSWTSSAAAECITLMAAGGYVVHTFPTGQGNVIGNPIVPVVKITGNPKTVRTMSEHVDLDVSGVLRRDMTIPEAGDALIEMVVRTANGRLPPAESLVTASS